MSIPIAVKMLEYPWEAVYELQKDMRYKRILLLNRHNPTKNYNHANWNDFKYMIRPRHADYILSAQALLTRMRRVKTYDIIPMNTEELEKIKREIFLMEL